jgi:nucleotide-binding universal stress UspA family protein
MEVFMNEANRTINYNNMSYQLIEGEQTEDALDKYLDDESTGMLILSTHHRFFFKRLFDKSITKHMAYHSTVPLMAFHVMKSPILVF